MRRHELSDEQWELIQDELPEAEGAGRPWRDHRQVVNGMMWILRTGAPWRDLPERFGPWQTIYERFTRWSRDGTVDRILEKLQIRLDREGRIDWDLWCIDGSSIRASRAAAGAGKKGDQKSRKTMVWAAQEADSAASCTWYVTAREFRLRSKSARVKHTNRDSSGR